MKWDSVILKAKIQNEIFISINIFLSDTMVYLVGD